LGGIGTGVSRAAVQLVELLDVALGKSGSGADDILVVPVFWHHGDFTVAESCFVVMHDGPVVVGVAQRVDFRGFVEVEPHILFDVV